MTQIKTSQRKGKASLAALTAGAQNSDLVFSSAGVISASQGALAKEPTSGFASVDASYYLAKEPVGLAMTDVGCDIAREANIGAFA